MKKLIYCVATLVATLFAASCAQEDLQPVGGNTVSFKVEIPEVATKAEAVGNDAKMIDDLVYAVYRTTAGSVAEALENWNVKTTFLYAINSPAELKRFKDGTDIISLELLNDQNHIVLLWAQHNDTWVREQGGNIKLTEITYPSSLEVSADVADKYAAFSAVKFIAANDKSNVEPIKLTRPFAQINLATVDPREYNVVINSTTLTVNAAGDKFNVAAQRPTDIKDVTYSWAGKVYEDGLTVNSQSYDHYLAMGYVFAAGNVSVDYVIETNKHGIIDNTVTNVPVEKNYRTNIIGNLLTSDVKYNVTLDKNWGDEGENMEVLCEGVVKNINGDYEVSTLEGLVYAINNLFVYETGAANAGTFYVKPGIYDMAEHALNDIVVRSGTLKVYGSETVVTRTVASGNGVIISGLKNAIINGVAAGTTVFFSGITIEDFEGEDDAAALVQNNSGKVVLAGCNIVDENGNPDEDTELVGGNDPVVVEKGEEGATDLIYTAEQLAAAFADETVESIALGADIALENTLVFPEGRTATLDLRGWELTIADPDKVATTYALNNHGTLTIKDSYATGQVNARGIYNGYGNGGENVSNAKLTIDGGTFNALGTNGGAAVVNYGVAEIKGGKFTSIGGYTLNNQGGASMTISEGVKANNGIYNSGATLTINGGEIEGNTSGWHVVYSWNSTVTINGGTIHNNNSGNSTLMAAGTSEMTVTGGTFSIKDGRVEGNGNTWTSCLTDTQNTATLTVTGGTFNGGFRVQGGTTMNISGGTFDDCTGSNYNIYGAVSITGGTYTDATAKAFAAKYAHEDYKLVGDTIVPKVYVVTVGTKKYESVQEAVDAAEAGSTITFIADVEQEDGVLITDKNLTIDLNGKTFTVSEGGSTNNRNFKVNGSSVVTIKNGTMVADGELTSGAYGTVRTEDSANVTLNNVKSNSYRGYGLNIKANTGTTITINNSEIYAQYSGGVEAAGGKIVLNNVKITQEGVYSSGAHCSVAIGVNGGGKVTVNSGEYSAAAIATDSNAAQGTWVAYVMSSGGTLEINDGTFNGTVAETANAANACGLICADRAAVVEIKGGTFNSNGAILDMRNNVGTQPNPVATLYGGTFSADPRVSGLYSSNLITVAEGYSVVEKDDMWIIAKPIATVGNVTYYGIDEAIAAWTNGSTLTLLDNVTLSDVITLKSTEHHTLDLGIYTLTAASGKNAIEVTCNGLVNATYALTVNADATNPGGITAAGKSCIYYNKSDSTKDRPIIRIYNGVFNGSYSIYSKSNGNTNCTQVWIYGGVFNANVDLTKNMLRVFGGTFNGSVTCTGDTSAYRQFTGGRFKKWSFMTADGVKKFGVGTRNSDETFTYDVGVYVDKDGYLVVGGPVITEENVDPNWEEKQYSTWSSYLKYSSAATYGLYYEK